MSNNYLSGVFITIAALCITPAAEAHLLLDEDASWSAGFIHPFVGMDHLLAMLAVGLWAAQQGGSRIWQLPAAFLSMMMIGAYFGHLGVTLPATETGIAGSLMALGLLLALSAHMSLLPSLLVVGFFAMFHGFAHGTEMPQSLAVINYAGGFLFATAALHGLGIALALFGNRFNDQNVLRLSGLAIGITGGLLWI